MLSVYLVMILSCFKLLQAIRTTALISRTSRNLPLLASASSFLPHNSVIMEPTTPHLGNPPYRLSSIQFDIDGEIVGYLTKEYAEHVLKFPHVFIRKAAKSITLSDSLIEQVRLYRGCLEGVRAVTEAIATVTESMREQGLVPGWRNELLPISLSYNEPPLFLLERSACPIFGARAYGVHVNGYVRKGAQGEVSHLWVGKRSATKSTWPGMLDHIAAGGQPYGISLKDNVVKECEEEGTIPSALSCRARPVGAVTYHSLDPLGNLKRDAIFCYDLELPSDFVPVPSDGEVECFEQKDLEWVLRRMIDISTPGGYKPNCNHVIIDFFIRHGLIDPESPHYLELITKLRISDSK